MLEPNFWIVVSICLVVIFILIFAFIFMMKNLVERHIETETHYKEALQTALSNIDDCAQQSFLEIVTFRAKTLPEGEEKEKFTTILMAIKALQKP